MELIDNINSLLGDDLKQTLKPGVKLKIAASCFSIYAYEALKSEFESVESLQFIFTSPTFVADEVTDKIRKEQREFHIPKIDRERNLYGSEFEIQLRNKLTQRAIAKECADRLRRKATFRSNRYKPPMQQFACVQGREQDVAYMPLHGFTAIDPGFVKELAKRQPLRVVFRDAGFKSDSVKINVEQIFKLLSPSTDVKCI